jgi:hypothetical protein
MEQNRSTTEEHARLCAVKNIGTALYFVAACLLMVYLNWKDLGKPYHKISTYYLFWDIASSVAIFQLMIIFRCAQERFILSLGLLISLRAVVSRFAPDLLNRFASPLRQAFFALWVVGLFISLSMIASSAFKPKTL